MLTPCSSRRNCVSSIDTDRRHYVAPLNLKGSQEDAWYHLIMVLNATQRMRVTKADNSVIHAEAASAILRFVDDVEFFLNEKVKLIHVKSASRKGYFGLGANRRRIEKIRKHYNEVIDHAY